MYMYIYIYIYTHTHKRYNIDKRYIHAPVTLTIFASSRSKHGLYMYVRDIFTHVHMDASTYA